VPTGNEPIILNQDGWVARIEPPRQNGPDSRVILLIHGLHGDENVMWVFTRNLPETYWLVAPRAPVQTKQGYSWLQTSERWPALAEFAASASAIITQITRWLAQVGAPQAPFDVMGFSQGAAMAYALAAFYPKRIHNVVALAGFLPRDEDEPGRYSALQGKRIYVAHGSRDETIPLQMAEDAVQTLQSLGAEVTYCASDTGHKLSASCLRGLEEFLKQPAGK
jgi:phospholipase/carboxylesterase